MPVPDPMPYSGDERPSGENFRDNTGVAWPTEGDRLDAELGDIEGCAKNIATIAKNWSDDIMGGLTLLLGKGDHWAFSHGAHPEARTCQYLVDRNARVEFLEGFGMHLAQTLASVSSALFVYRDLLASADATGASDMAAISADVVRWSFAEPGVARPSGIPAHIKNKTIADVFAEDAEDKEKDPGEGADKTPDDVLIDEIYRPGAGQVERHYRTADGEHRIVTINIAAMDGVRHHEELRDTDGVRKSETVERVSGETVTTYFAKDGDAVVERRTTATTEKDAGGYQRVDKSTTIEEFDKDGTAKRTVNHIVTDHYDDGTESTTYYTEQDDGSITDQRHIPRQPPPPEGGVSDETRKEFEQQQELLPLERTEEPTQERKLV